MMMFLKGEKIHVFYSIVLGVIGGLVGTAIFGLSGYMIALSFFEPPFFLIILIIAVIKMFGLTKGTTKYLERLLSHDATFKMIGRLRAAYFKRSVESNQDTHSVRYIQKLTTYFNDIEDYYVRIIYPYIVAVFIALILTVLSLIVDPILLMIILGVSFLLLVIMPLIISRISRVSNNRRLDSEDRLFSRLYHYIFDYVNLYTVNETEQTKDNLRATYKEITANENKESQVDVVIEVMSLLIQLAAIIGVILLFKDESPLLVPMIILLLMSFFELIIPVIKPASKYRAVKDRVNAVTTEQVNTEIEKPDNLSLSQLTFRYPETKLDVLKDISLEINEGEQHVIIGSSGSGKTTLLNQLIKKSSAGVMPQHLDFYNATVEENLTMFGALDKINAIEQLREYELNHFALNEYITSNEYLSLGEKKRMHLIRLILEDKSTWILDEPTASLNTRLRDKVWKTIFNKETLIVATHDLSHLESFDFVHYLENGKIIESGSVDTVLSHSGPTREAYDRYKDSL